MDYIYLHADVDESRLLSDGLVLLANLFLSAPRPSYAPTEKKSDQNGHACLSQRN